jgi:hypothetical protein
MLKDVPWSGFMPLKFVSGRQTPHTLCFDHEGEYFCGFLISDFLPGKGHFSMAGELLSARPTSGLSKTPERSYADGSSSELSLPYRDRTPTLQRLGEVSSYIDDSGKRSISQLRDSGHEGIVLATLKDGGRMEAELVTRLPKQISHTYQATLLSRATGTRDHERRSILLSHEERPFRRHRVQETASMQLPLLLDRERDTIQKVSGRGTYSLDNGLGLTSKSLKRLGWFEEESQSKRSRPGR